MNSNLKKYWILVVFVSLSAVYSCGDIMEDDIQKKEIVLIAPKENFYTNIPEIKLSWQNLDGAEYYNLKIVSPSFDPDSIEEIVIDTNLTVNSFQIVLEEGRYQWGVYAWNGVSSTDLFYRNLYVDSISVPIVIPVFPSADAALNSESIKFSWTGKDDFQYIFSLSYKEDLIFTTITENTSISLPKDATFSLTLEEGKYKWQIQARDADGNVSELKDRSFYIDRTEPAVPVLISPRKDSVFHSSPITLIWEEEADTGSVVKNVIEIAYDDVFSDMVKTATIINETEYKFSPTIDTTFYWHVKCIDEAGNESEFSNTLKFRYKDAK